jgi:biopolymer transport protein ExbD
MNLRSRSKVSAEVNMSSMTDLVFLLLVFFIIASSYITTGVNIELPSSSTTTPQTQNITLTIKLDKENPQKEIFYIDKKPIQEADINSTLKEYKDAQQVGADKDKQPVLLLRVDKNIKTETTVRMLDLGYKNNLKVILATSPSQDID